MLNGNQISRFTIIHNRYLILIKNCCNTIYLTAIKYNDKIDTEIAVKLLYMYTSIYKYIPLCIYFMFIHKLCVYVFCVYFIYEY